MMIQRVAQLVMLILTLMISNIVEGETLEDIARELQILDHNSSTADKYALVAVNFVTIPLRRWGLLRKGRDICAIRFTGFRHDPAKNEYPSTTRDSFYAFYDRVYQGDGSENIAKPNVKSGHGEASMKPNIWRFIRGERYINCGSIRAKWWYPNRIFLVKPTDLLSDNPTTSTKPNGIEIALTGWSEIKEINVHDPKLIWHRFDPQRDSAHINDKPKIVPVEKLPGYESQ